MFRLHHPASLVAALLLAITGCSTTGSTDPSSINFRVPAGSRLVLNRDVRIGAGWARRGMWLLLLPYFKGIDAMAEGLAVSFVAPDGTPSGGVYALHMHTPEEAQTLAGLLWAEQAPIPGDG